VWGLRYIDDLILRDRDTDDNDTLDERLYSLQDANWNVTGLVNTSGVMQQRFVYTAYGLPVFLTSSFTAGSNTAGWEVLYAGYRFEPATSLMHVRHRVLNPALGCWVQRDPIGYSDGLNLFSYVQMAPLHYVDGFGMQLAPPPGVNPVCFNACAAILGLTCISFGLIKGYQICFGIAALCALTPAPVICAVGVVVICIPLVTAVTCRTCLWAAFRVCSMIC